MKLLSYLLVLLVFVGSVHTAQANYTIFGVPTTVSVNGTSAVKLAANSNRTYLLIQNNCSVGVIVKFGSVQTGTEGVLVPAGGNYEPLLAPTNSVFAITVSSTGTNCLIFQQGVGK